ncbi:hypothetical protein EDB86DRAFT_2992968 [Lactarius hatsudake]|nr:hypothetical protein EDB86DRAFT_2992968 [Lactarius hatsudake]
MGVSVNAVCGSELDLNFPFPDPAHARHDASSKHRCEERGQDIEINTAAALGNVWSVWRLASIDLFTVGRNSESNTYYLDHFDRRKKPALPCAQLSSNRQCTHTAPAHKPRKSPLQESTTIRRSHARMASGFLPNARLLTRYAGDFLCRELRDEGAGGAQAQSRGKWSHGTWCRARIL